jgi:transcriptional regulator GlxA family with amidase domain
MENTTQIAIHFYEDMTALDAVGPYQVLVLLPGAEVKLVAAKVGPVRTDTGLYLVADSTFTHVPSPDIILIPGGLCTKHVIEDKHTLDWIKAADKTSTWTTSVCTGALILGAAGLLKGLAATTHWNALSNLAQYDATPVSNRVVHKGKIITGGGVSAGIDTALYLAALVAGEEVAKTIQLSIQYDPEPPFNSGSPATASTATLVSARESLSKRIDKLNCGNKKEKDNQ